MKLLIIPCALLLCILGLLGAAEAPYDILIRHGHIIDGAGNPWYAGDIAIRGDRIAAIGSLGAAQAKRVIDASGLVVSPGFIDMLGQTVVPVRQISSKYEFNLSGLANGVYLMRMADTQDGKVVFKQVVVQH